MKNLVSLVFFVKHNTSLSWENRRNFRINNDYSQVFLSLYSISMLCGTDTYCLSRLSFMFTCVLMVYIIWLYKVIPWNSSGFEFCFLFVLYSFIHNFNCCHYYAFNITDEVSVKHTYRLNDREYVLYSKIHLN